MAFVQKDSGKYVSDSNCPNCGYASTYHPFIRSEDLVQGKTMSYSEQQYPHNFPYAITFEVFQCEQCNHQRLIIQRCARRHHANYMDCQTLLEYPYPISQTGLDLNKVPHDNAIEGGSVLWEGLSEMMESFFLMGNERNSFCWQGNAWYKNAMQNSHDPHWVGGDLFFELCNQYGFDYDDLPALFKELDDRSGNTNERDFVNIVNNIIGSDTSHLFRNAGVI